MGLHRAGFDVFGVDIKPQRNYPFPIVQGDALAPPFNLSDFDFIWASPPCQVYSITAKLWPSNKHPDLIKPVRRMLESSRVPYVIENVCGAPLINPIMLCGTHFGLRVFRHRIFETSFFMMTPPHPTHRGTTNSSRTYSRFSTGADMICVAGHNFHRRDAAEAMDIPWHMPREELAQAIPPAYSEFIGRAALRYMGRA